VLQVAREAYFIEFAEMIRPHLKQTKIYVTGTIENYVLLPQNTQASGSQLHQVGKGEERISDWSDKGEARRWVEAFEKETERKIKILPRVDSSGYPLHQATRRV
jgi:hypothetical protein